jgi:DNA topoisomerase-1
MFSFPRRVYDQVMVESHSLSSAEAAGLVYSSDGSPGWVRRRQGRGFSYFDTAGERIRDPEVRERLEQLAIPPAWTDVWINPLAHGHLQATGRDERGRKQYLYHPRWREVRDRAKFESLSGFAEQLPHLRSHVQRDLALFTGTPDRRTVTAALVQLLDATLIRIGNSEYARENASYGLTTLHDEHVNVQGELIEFSFRGKGGKEHEISLRNKRLARIVHNCQALPGQTLFQYEDQLGERHVISSHDVNSYLQEATERDYSAKDFRTWAGTVLAASKLHELEPATSAAGRKRNVSTAIRSSAAHLGNTPAVCRKSYVHPAVISSYLQGTFHQNFQTALETARQGKPVGLRLAEAATLKLLQEHESVDDHT